MPVYTYRCQNCGAEFDRQQSFSDKSLTSCPNCRKRGLYKVYRPAGVVFKGSGFYVTDQNKARSINGKTQKNNETAPEKAKAKSEKKTSTEGEKNKPATKKD
jgi:putative FmdB family regulatory protein